MSDLPSHVSPYFSPRPVRPRHAITDYSLNSDRPTSSSSPNHRDQFTTGSSAVEARAGSPNDTDDDFAATRTPPKSLLSPPFTLPSTPDSLLSRPASSIGLGDQITDSRPPKLLPRLPHVECIVRARIPTTAGAEMFLHLYQNDVDDKEHLAIVFGNTIRSRSLDRVKEGETEMDRMIRGAYVGRLRPGRISSRYDKAEGDGHIESKTAGTVEGPASSRPVSRPMQDKPIVGGPQGQAPLVRIHSECYTGETAWSARCDCGEQLDEAARLMSEPSVSSNGYLSSSSSGAGPSPGGIIVYLRQEGRGIGLGEKLKAYNLQDLGSDTVEANLLLRHPADARSYGLATAILVDLGLGADSANGGIRLLTNNPDKVLAVEGPNREVVVKERVPMIPLAWRTGGKRGIKSSEVERYLRTKIGKMGHMINN